MTPDRFEDDDTIDQTLARQARTDRAAFETLCRRHLDRVHRLAVLRTRSRAAAEQATVATFERAAGAFDGLDPASVSVRAWFCHLAAVELSRSDAARPDGATGGVLDGLDRLKPREQQVVLLSFMGDLSDEEVAAALGRSRATVGLVLERAVTRFADKVQINGDRLTTPEAIEVLSAFASAEAAPPDPTLADRVIEALRPSDHSGPRRRRVIGDRPGRVVLALVTLGALAVFALVLLARGGPPTVELIEGADLTILLPDGNEIDAEPGLGVPPGSTVITGPDGFARFESGEVGPDTTAEVRADRVEVVEQADEP